MRITHDHYLMAQAWPSYRPELTMFQLEVGVQIHRLYEKKRLEHMARMMRGTDG